MRLWIPGDPGLADEDAANVARESVENIARDRVAAASERWGQPYVSAGLAVRFRFVHLLPAGPLAVKPPFPTEPTVPELVALWAGQLESVLWRDASQLVQVFARREWGNAAGVEVSL